MPLAEMAVSAEPVKAREVAVDRLLGVLDLLRYSMPFLSDADLDPDISLLKETGRVRIRSLGQEVNAAILSVGSTSETLPG